MRRTTRRGFAVFAATTAALITVAACSSGSGSAKSTSGADAASDVHGSITVWDEIETPIPAWGKAFVQIDKQFEKLHPGVTIKRVAVPNDPNLYEQKFRAAATARSGPDVVMPTPGYNGTLGYTSSLVALTPDDLKGFPVDDLIGWDTVAKGYNASKGPIYGIPAHLSSYMFLYNKTLFSKAGLDPGSPPKTFDELEADAAKLKAAGVQPIAGGNAEGYMSGWLESLMWAGIGSPAETSDLARGVKGMTDPTFQAALQKYIDLVKAGDFGANYASTPLATGLNQFNNGKAAMVGMYWSGPSQLSSLKFPVSDVGVFEPVAINQPATTQLPSGPWINWSITKWSKNQATALAYIKYVASPDVQKQIYHLAGFPPNIKDDTNLAPPAGGDPIGQQLLADYRTATDEFPIHGTWPLQAELQLEKQLQLVIAGQESVEKATSNADAVRKQAMASFN